MRKPPATITNEVEILLREQARLRLPIMSVKRIARVTGLHRNTVQVRLKQFMSDEGQNTIHNEPATNHT